MNIRPFQLPEDIDLMNSLVKDGFQYPENPEWSVQEDEVQGMIDRINGGKRLWPLLRVMRVFSPLFRDILCGFIAEEENKPAGLINYMRQRDQPEWFIANVTVLPAYRRRGIARKLVETTLRELRDRKAKIAFLNVVVGNDPAFKLYQEMGFEAFTTSSEYHYRKGEPVSPIALPDGYKLKPLSRFDWRARFTLAKRITPEHVTRYEPVTNERFHVPFIMSTFEMLFEAAGGVRSEHFVIYSPDEHIVGIGQYSYRTRAGGVNFASISIDPKHPQLADFCLRHILTIIQSASPGHRTRLNLEGWEFALIEAAEVLGFEKRFGAHRMGLRF